MKLFKQFISLWKVPSTYYDDMKELSYMRQKISRLEADLKEAIGSISYWQALHKNVCQDNTILRAQLADNDRENLTLNQVLDVVKKSGPSRRLKRKKL